MDSKKANLTPELKEIYDRVMNTSGAPKPTTPPPAQPQPSPTGTLPPSPNQVPNAPVMPTSPVMPSLGSPIAQSMPQPQMPPQAVQPQMDMAPQMPESPSVGYPNPAEEALSSTPARPLAEGNSFAYNGKGKPASPQTPGGTEKKKMAISKPILIVLGVVFVAVWGVFWAIILGLIQR